MKGIFTVLIPVCFPVLLSFAAGVSTPSGFSLPDSVNEMVLKYRTVKDLIVLPVTINDSIKVNLILDTGCRNLILFGKKFRRMFNMYNLAFGFSNRPIANSQKPIANCSHTSGSHP